MKTPWRKRQEAREAKLAEEIEDRWVTALGRSILEARDAAREQEGEFQRHPGARMMLRALAVAGALHPDFEGHIKEWLDAPHHGYQTLTINGHRVI
jgi:hypothetical protein